MLKHNPTVNCSRSVRWMGEGVFPSHVPEPEVNHFFSGWGWGVKRPSFLLFFSAERHKQTQEQLQRLDSLKTTEMRQNKVSQSGETKAGPLSSCYHSVSA